MRQKSTHESEVLTLRRHGKPLLDRNRYLLFAAPSLIVMALIMIFPVCYSIYYSFFDYKLGTPATFSGFENYAYLLKNSEFWNAMGFSAGYTVVTVFFQVVLGMGIALLLDRITRGRKIISILIYLPYFIAASSAGIIFRWMCMSDWGLIDQVLSLVGISLPSWFDSPGLSRVIVCIAEIWQNTPFAIIVFFAGLQSVSADQMEAASIDGANAFRKFWSIKLPHLRHLITLVLTMRIMDAFRVYDRIVVLTAGGPGTSTQSISLFAYITAFTKLRIGRGSAIGVLILVALVIPVFILLKIMRSEEA
ncbi:Trehalose transport system permease protein SugA [bioreactor metagenome]|uniref:Trehalose transport system permease protein SugA n=1 Tax=bioreactor metagenome TaxID=1076179 RepID=A0A644YG65_9ZZZZ